MAFPTVASRSSGGQSTNTRTHPWTAPSGVVAGNLLIAFYSFDSDNALDINPTATTTSSGWTKVGQASQNANNVTQALFYKQATGSDALTVVTDTEEQSQHIIYRIAGGGVPTFTSSQGNTANSDPPLHTPAGGSNEYLWIVSRAGDREVVASAAPAGYSTMQTRQGVGNSSCSLQTAERTNVASSENPAAFTVDAEEWVCFTVSVPPGSSAPPVATDTPGSILNIGPIPGQNHFNVGIGYTSGHLDKSQAQIAAGFSEPGYFELSPVAGWVRCSVPLDGKTTSSNTQYARVELREMQENGTTRASWDAGSGMHRIHITSKLIKSPPNKPQLVFCQIHDAEDDVAMILCRLQSGDIDIVARKGDTQVVTMQADYATDNTDLPGDEITVGFEVEDGELRYYFNNLDTPVYTTTLTGTGHYFKAGAYAQSNTTIDSLSDGPFIVDIKELEHWHTGWATPAVPPASGGGGGGGGTPGAPFYASQYPDGTAYDTFREGTTVVNVSNTSGLNSALSSAVAGQRIVLANGTYGAHTLSGRDGSNSVGQGISIVAANRGQANLTSLTINNSNYVHVEGLAFPADPAGDTLQIRGDSQFVRVTRCTLGPTSHPGSATSGDAGTYIFVGDNVQRFRIDHNYLRNKSRSGNGIRVYGNFDTFAGCRYGRIDHNRIENFYPEAVNDCEPIRYGVSTMSRTNASAVIERNHFFNCVSEPELISGKMGRLRITGNTAQRCGGSFVIRHGRDSIMSDNYVIDGAGTTGTAGMKSGGYRFYDSDHTVDHNYGAGLGGDTFQASLIIDTGDEEGSSETLSGHFRVVNCLIRNNVIVDSLTGIKVGDNYSDSPTGCTVTGNRTANIGSGSPPITYVGTTTLVSSTVSDNVNAASATALGLAADSDNIYRDGGLHGPRITFIKASMVGPDADLDDLDGTGPGIASVIPDPDDPDDPDPDPELPPEEQEPEPEADPPVNDMVQVQLPKTWYLGPAGDVRPLTAIDTGATVTQVRYGGVHQGLSGARTLDVTGLSADYDLSWKYLDESEYSWLELLHTRHIPGPLRLLNPLKRNRLSARASRLVPATTAGLGAMTTSPYTKTRDWPAAVAVPGQSLSVSGWVQSNQSVRFDANLPTTVLNLETITFSVYVRSLAAHSGSVGLEFYDYAGNFLSSTTEPAEFDVVWDRYSITRQVPSKTCTVVARVGLATANTFVRIAAPQLEAGSSATAWEPGGGAPVVVIDQMPVTTPRFPLRDVSVTLLEV